MDKEDTFRYSKKQAPIYNSYNALFIRLPLKIEIAS